MEVPLEGKMNYKEFLSLKEMAYELLLASKLNDLLKSLAISFWWQKQTIGESLKQLKKLVAMNAVHDPILVALYTQETWMSELPIQEVSDSDTVMLSEHVITEDEKSFVTFLVGTGMPYEKATKKWIEASNLNVAVKDLFGGVSSNDEFNAELIHKIHCMLMLNLLPPEEIGVYRTTLAGAYQSTVVYAKPAQIQPRLESLLKFVNLNMRRATLTVAMAVGALFFSEFLLIHPFKDGISTG
jgi:hypothetical protein